MPETKQPLPVILLMLALLALAAMFFSQGPHERKAPFAALRTKAGADDLSLAGKEIETISISGSIVVSAPHFGEEVSKSFTLEGQARQGVGREISVQLKASESNALLFSGTVITDPEREKELAHFSREVPLPDGLINNLSLTLEVAPLAGQGEIDVSDTVLIPLMYTRATKKGAPN